MVTFSKITPCEEKQKVITLINTLSYSFNVSIMLVIRYYS